MGRCRLVTAAAASPEQSIQQLLSLFIFRKLHLTKMPASEMLNHFEKTNNVIIAISEGIRDKDGNYISAAEAGMTFGHSQLSDGKALY